MEDATAMSASLVRVSPSVLLYRTAGHEAEVVPDVQGSGLRLPGSWRRSPLLPRRRPGVPRLPRPVNRRRKGVACSGWFLIPNPLFFPPLFSSQYCWPSCCVGFICCFHLVDSEMLV
ncbi:hypothetical protein BHM03_00018926 [Ensete ventricosum]|nr:hypothetical protein BHM03_00018926 [Ensete ventricosum]